MRAKEAQLEGVYRRAFEKHHRYLLLDLLTKELEWLFDIDPTLQVLLLDGHLSEETKGHVSC